VSEFKPMTAATARDLLKRLANDTMREGRRLHPTEERHIFMSIIELHSQLDMAMLRGYGGCGGCTKRPPPEEAPEQCDGCSRNWPDLYADKGEDR